MLQEVVKITQIIGPLNAERLEIKIICLVLHAVHKPIVAGSDTIMLKIMIEFGKTMYYVLNVRRCSSQRVMNAHYVENV